MTPTQEREQCDGPGQPSAGALAAMLDTLPKHVKVRAVSINGQAGTVSIEVTHEGLDNTYKFPTQ